jgi:outer membrane protein OmpA-like peptidoglycan-associated protein
MVTIVRPGRVAALTSVAALLLATSTMAPRAIAQPVRTFDDAPTVEQLRNIMVPESRPGASRTIVIQRPNTGTTPAPVQPAATEPVPLPQHQSAPAYRPPPETAQPAAEAATTAAAPAEQAGSVAFHINFAFNSAVLPDSAHLMIERVAQLMKETPDLKLRVEGHTDAAGSAEYNKSLSEARAISVARYLAAQGVAADRLLLVGKGKTEPLTHDPYEPANRRVQFVRIG